MCIRDSCPQAAADGEGIYGGELKRTYSQNWTLGWHLDGLWRLDVARRRFVRDTSSSGPLWWSPELRAATVRGSSSLVLFGEESIFALPREYLASPLNDGYFLAQQGPEPFGSIDPRDAFGPIHRRSRTPESLANDLRAQEGDGIGFANAGFVDGHVSAATYAGRYELEGTTLTRTMLLLRDDLPNNAAGLNPLP